MARNVTVVRTYTPSELGWTRSPPDQTMNFFNNVDGARDYWKSVARNYFRPNAENLSPYKCDELDKALASGKKVLAVLARGTDYLALKPYGHPIVPTAEQMIDDVRRLLNRFDLIYLVTEDRLIYDAFAHVFGKLIIRPRQGFLEYRGKGWIGSVGSLKRRYCQGYAYLKAILDVGRCQGFLAARTSGAVGAVLLADNSFEYEYYYDLGTY